MDKYYIPQHLDAPFKLILWTLDEVVVFLIPFSILFFVFNHPLLSVGVGMLMVLLLKRLKGEQGHYFIYQLGYWYLPEIIKLKCTAPSYLRQMIG